jgi:TusE/DsrC/DsvC family sulfur relay protein
MSNELNTENHGFELNGKFYKTDEDGHLYNFSDWNEGVALYFAGLTKIEMGEDHWMVINFLREYYDEYKIGPHIRILSRAMSKKLGHSKGNTMYLYELFPGGQHASADRIAGLPKYRGC